jgi:HSP20 family protein
MKHPITRRSPFGEPDDLESRLGPAWPIDPFSHAGAEESLAIAEWSPRVDITEDRREFLITAELPKMKRDEVKVTVEGGSLSITGERRFEKEDRHKKFHRIEREFGTFARTFTLPAGTSGARVSAEFKDGVLTIHLPKDQKASAKAVEVKAGSPSGTTEEIA